MPGQIHTGPRRLHRLGHNGGHLISASFLDHGKGKNTLWRGRGKRRFFGAKKCCKMPCHLKMMMFSGYANNKKSSKTWRHSPSRKRSYKCVTKPKIKHTHVHQPQGYWQSILPKRFCCGFTTWIRTWCDTSQRSRPSDSARRNWGDTGTVITVILQGGILRWCWWTSAIVLGCFGAPHKAYITTGTLIVIMAGHHHLWIPNVSWIGWREQEAMEETIDVVCVFVPYNRSSNFVYVSLSTSSRNQQFLAAFSAL